MGATEKAYKHIIRMERRRLLQFGFGFNTSNIGISGIVDF